MAVHKRLERIGDKLRRWRSQIARRRRQQPDKKCAQEYCETNAAEDVFVHDAAFRFEKVGRDIMYLPQSGSTIKIERMLPMMTLQRGMTAIVLLAALLASSSIEAGDAEDKAAAAIE